MKIKIAKNLSAIKAEIRKRVASDIKKTSESGEILAYYEPVIKGKKLAVTIDGDTVEVS